jgi:glutamate racemase
MVLLKPSPNVAFFDSGQGGLTVWENVIKKFPNLNTQYLGDNARCPYGNKGDEVIQRYAKEAISFLSERNAGLLVVACGTVSSVAVRKLQSKYSFPVIGIVDGFCRYVSEIVKPLSRPVAVLATRYTIKSKRFVEELGFYGMTHVWDRACPLFVPLVEEGISAGPLVDDACDMYLWDIPRDVKVVMLACTHYPRIALPIADCLKRLTGRSVVMKRVEGDWLLALGDKDREDPIYLVDASTAIVNEVYQFLKKADPHGTHYFGKERMILCTDSPKQFQKAARFFTTQPVENVEKVNLSYLVK